MPLVRQIGGRQSVVPLSLNWYPNPNVRFMVDYLHGLIQKGTSTGAETGGDFDAVAVRTQIAF